MKLKIENLKNKKTAIRLLLYLLCALLIYGEIPFAFAKNLDEKNILLEKFKTIKPILYDGTSKAIFGWGTAVFYPLGFSKRGFAHISSTMGSPSDAPWCFIIQDLVSDKGLYANGFERFGREGKVPTEENISLSELFKLNGNIIFPALEKHQIIISNTTKLRAFPIKWQDDEFNVLYAVEGEKPAEGYEPFKMNIQLQSKKKGLKNIGEFNGTTSGRECCDILGYFESPFEKRIVVLIGTTWWDEGSLMGDFMTVGADLTKGFKQTTKLIK